MDKLIKLTWSIVLTVLLISIIVSITLAFSGGTPEVVGVMAGKFMAVMLWIIIILYILKFAFFRNRK